MPVVTLFVLPKQTRCCQFWQKPRVYLIDLSIYRSLRAPSRRRYDDGVFIVNHHVVISVLRGDLRDEEGAQNGLCTDQTASADQAALSSQQGYHEESRIGLCGAACCIGHSRGQQQDPLTTKGGQPYRRW